MKKDMTLDQMEEFTGKSAAFGKEPTISILKSGRIGFNRAADNKWLKGYSHIKLFWDEKTRVIGLKLLKKPDPGAYEIKRTSTSSFYISCMAFYNYIGLSKKRGVPSEIVGFNEREEAIFVRLLDEKN